MPKNMFSNFRYHLIVPFVKICDIHASIPAIIRKYWSSSTLLKPIICYGSMVLKQLHLIRAMSVQTECRATRASSKELCWGEAWLRRRQCQCKNVILSKNTSIELYKIILNTYLLQAFPQAASIPYLPKRAKPPTITRQRLASKKVGGDLLSHGCAVPSARLGLTSLFGMGRGGTPRL